jgi:hypothetical protein
VVRRQGRESRMARHDATPDPGQQHAAPSCRLGSSRTPRDEPSGHRGDQVAVTVVQRTSADLKLNPHLHLVALDGVFVAGPDGKPVFHALPRISDTAVADLLAVIRARRAFILLTAQAMAGEPSVEPARDLSWYAGHRSTGDAEGRS